MDALLSYYEKNSFYIEAYKEKYKALDRLKKYLNDPEELRIYILNFCKKDLEEIIYIFLKDKIIEIVFNTEQSSLKTIYNVYRLDDLKYYQFSTNSSFGCDTKLSLYFDETVLELDNFESEEIIIDEEELKKKEINANILEGIFEFLLKNKGI